MDYDTLHDHCLVDDKLWDDLRKLDPGTVSGNCEIIFDADKRFYRIPVLNNEYGVFPDDKKILFLSDNGQKKKNEMELELFLVYYLLGTSNIPLAGKHVSEKELKGGEMFFRGPHAIPAEEIIKKFGNDKQGFLNAGIALGAEPAEFGDASIILYPAPKLPVTYVLWTADEEFPASVNALFDPTIQEFLPLDVIYGLCIYIYQSLVR